MLHFNKLTDLIKSHEGSSILNIENESLNLVLLEQIDLLGHTSKQKKKVNSSQGTKEKVVLTELSSIITKSSVEIGREHLQMIENIIYHTCTIIKESSNPEETLDNVIDILKPNSNKKTLSVSRQAVKDNLPKNTKRNLDIPLKENYIACMNELDSFHAKSKEVILAIDTTPEASTSKYLNNQYSWVHKGQSNTWKRGFVFFSIYDSTHQLFISNEHQDFHVISQEDGIIQDYITKIQHACTLVEQTGSKIKYLDADRGFYQGELFAAAYFGVLAEQCKTPYDIKVIVPKKFTRGKDEKKVAFLEDYKAKEVSLDYIQLSKYTHPALIGHCEEARLEKVDSMYHIPIVKVAIVDGYSTKKNRDLDQLREEWKINKINLKTSKERASTLNKQYVLLQQQKGFKEPKPLLKMPQQKRKYKKHPDLRILYNKIYKTLKYIKKLKREKEKILTSLMFFNISLTPEEVSNFNPEKYLKVVKIYKERWGIESGYKEDKAKFVRSCQSRKSTDRQWNLSLGMMLYNHWHVERMRIMLMEERKYRWNKVPWDPNKPYMRRKLERKYSRALSAESYLLQLLEQGIKKRLEKVFK